MEHNGFTNSPLCHDILHPITLPAAPLELGNFLPGMAGKPVFKAAHAGDLALRLLTMGQQLVLSTRPGWLLQTLFAQSADADSLLLKDQAFVRGVTEGLRHSLIDHASAYRRELRAYVKPWANALSGVRADVMLWHGRVDSWAPLAMSEALRERLPNSAVLNVCEGLAHYSTLRHVLPVLLAQMPS